MPEFICIQEAWVYQNSLPTIPGYSFIHTFRQTKKGGGSAIYVKDSIDYSCIENITYSDIDFEVAGVTFCVNNTDNVTLLSVYIPPAQVITLDHLNKLIIHKNLIILGDLNAKHKFWGAPINDCRGRII